MPIGMTTIFEAMMFNAATLIMGTFGTASLAAHQIAINVPSITFMVPLGIGMAATVRVGMAAGRGDCSRRAPRRLQRHGHGCGLHGGDGHAAVVLTRSRSRRSICRHTPANADVIRLRGRYSCMWPRSSRSWTACRWPPSLSLRGLKDARAPMWIAGGELLAGRRADVPVARLRTAA